MKRIVTQLLVATGLVIGAVGAAQAHTDLHVGVSLGAPAYAAPAPVYVRPAAPHYRAPYWRHEQPEIACARARVRTPRPQGRRAADGRPWRLSPARPRVRPGSGRQVGGC